MLFRLPGSNSAREKIIPTRENSQKYAREFFFVPVKKYQKKPISARENDKSGVKKVKKARKSGRETLILHVKKCKKRSKIGFHVHFRFHAQKKKTMP